MSINRELVTLTNKQWYIYIMEYYVTVSPKERKTAWEDHQDILLGGKSKMQNFLKSSFLERREIRINIWICTKKYWKATQGTNKCSRLWSERTGRQGRIVWISKYVDFISLKKCYDK